jgi:uncharacterized protein (TIGR02145 family)
MNRYLDNLVLGLAMVILGLTACKKEPGSDKLPKLVVLASPTSGFTTDLFDITILADNLDGGINTLFYRWDWNHDGHWDTPFSKNNKVQHRFFKPGIQVVGIECSDGKMQVKQEILTLEVKQGSSAPRTFFDFFPSKGNILTTYTFNATKTKDDEDSLDQLLFRWDFKGTGNWSTEFSKNPIANFVYNNPGLYNPKLQSKDPSGLTAIYTCELLVTLLDTLIYADFSMNDTLIRLGDTVELDASLSHHLRDSRRELLFSWLLPNITEWSIPNPEYKKVVIVNQIGQFTIKLKVIDKETKLFNQTDREFIAVNENLPPAARIQAGSIFGNILTQFYFDSWLSSDDYQSPSELEVRWDFNGDGEWDTPFSKEKASYHQYDIPGEFHVMLQVRDEDGLTSLVSKNVFVSANTNETSFFKDKRDGSFYGMVKIADQWWMSQNLNYIIPEKQRQGVLQFLCLFEQEIWCDQVGKLYRIGAVVENRADNEYCVVCPTGWRIPTKQDWESLFTAIGGEKNAKELRYGGKFDFNALDLGYANYRFIYNGPMIIDTVYEFKETFKKSWFFSSSEPYDPNHARVDIWQWGTNREDGQIWTGFSSTDIYMPIRCLKN